MKIYHVISETEWGSAPQLALDLCREFNRRGHSVEAITRKVEAIESRFKNSSATVHTAPLKGAFDVFSPVIISKLLREAPSDRTIIHTYRTKDAVTAARARALASRPDIRIVLSRLVDEPARSGASTEAIFREIDAVHFPAECFRRSFTDGKTNIDEQKLHTIRTRVSLPREISGAACSVRDPEQLNILTSGPIDRNKGLDTLIEATALLTGENVRLTILGVGPGPVVMPVIRRSRTLGIADRIDWRGDAGNLSKAISEADLAVCPEKDTKLLGLEFDTYTAHGIPVVASDTELHRELAEGDDNVTLFASGNAESLAEAIRNAAGKRGKRHSPGPDLFDNYAGDMEKLYLSLLR